MRTNRTPKAAAVFLLLLALSCGRGGGPERGGAGSGIKTERVEIRVDEAVISGNDAMAVLEPVVWTANIYGTLEEYESSLKPFSRPQRLLFALESYMAEVNNGGHEQFYSNSSGIVWPDALEAFALLEVPEGAAILLESAERLGGSPSRDRGERQAQLERLAPRFDDLDQRFDRLQNQVDFNAKMLERARRTPDDFRFSGTIERPVALSR